MEIGSHIQAGGNSDAVLNSEAREQPCGVGFISVSGFDAPQLAKNCREKLRI